MPGLLTRHRWTHADWLLLGFGVLLMGWLSTPLLYPASKFLTLHKVEVADSYVGYPIPLRFERTLWQATEYGNYSVEVINADTGTRVCLARREVPYSPNDKIVLGVLGGADKTVKWWAYSEDGECERWEPTKGSYYVKTRHCWKKFWWSREACNPYNLSNIFTIY